MKTVNSSEEAVEVVMKWRKKSNKCNKLKKQQSNKLKATNAAFCGLPTNKAKYLKDSNNFINIKKFEISKSTMVFKISIVKFTNKYPRMKKSSLSFHFLKKNFKIMKEVCNENAKEFK